VRRSKRARRSGLAFVRRLPEAEIRRKRTQDRWSVKDVVAHLVSCDEETIRRFRLIARGQADRIFWFESMADADRFNARTVARLRRLSLPALVRRMERAGADVVRWLLLLPSHHSPNDCRALSSLTIWVASGSSMEAAIRTVRVP